MGLEFRLEKATELELVKGLGRKKAWRTRLFPTLCDS